MNQVLLFLQMGDTDQASNYFHQVETSSSVSTDVSRCQNLINRCDDAVSHLKVYSLFRAMSCKTECNHFDLFAYCDIIFNIIRQYSFTEVETNQLKCTAYMQTENIDMFALNMIYFFKISGVWWHWVTINFQMHTNSLRKSLILTRPMLWQENSQSHMLVLKIGF